MEKTTFAVIGGDARNVYTKDILRRDGYAVKTFALCEEDERSLEAALENRDYIIAPTPFSKDSSCLNTPLYQKNLYIDDFLYRVSCAKYKTMFAGAISAAANSAIERLNINATDFLRRKEAAIRNAVPTAEAAIAIAALNSPVTIHGSAALIIGYGNIGKILAKYVRALGGYTYVAARREDSLAEAWSHGHKPVSLNAAALSKILAEADYIFNTAPFPIITANLVSVVNAGAAYIELASAPYGIDKDAAVRRGLNVIDAPSLPGRYAPKTAAEYIVKIIYKIIEEDKKNGN